MTFDDCLRAELAKGNPPMVALHNAVQRFAESLHCPCKAGPACKPTCTCHNPYLSGGCDRCNSYGTSDSSQYADETAAWSGTEESMPQDSEAVALLRDRATRLEKKLGRIRDLLDAEHGIWLKRVRMFLAQWSQSK